MKALVISGGGCKGAFAGGIADYLINVDKKEYDIFVGSSVGSLLITQLALGNVPKIKKAFTTIRNKDIFSISPFKVKEKNGEFDVSINHFNTIRAFLKGENSFGESKNLRKLIQKINTESDFEKLKVSKKVFFTVSNLTQQKVEYIDAGNCTYEDYCDWMWASANYVPFMSLITKNGNQYADGGFGSHVPVLHAIKQGATEIDVIILDEQQEHAPIPKLVNPFQSLMGVFKFMSNQIGLKDVLIGKLKGMESHVDVNLWYPPKNLTDMPLYFNEKQMSEWWQQGYDLANETNPISHSFLKTGEVKDIKKTTKNLSVKGEL